MTCKYNYLMKLNRVEKTSNFQRDLKYVQSTAEKDDWKWVDVIYELQLQKTINEMIYDENL